MLLQLLTALICLPFIASAGPHAASHARHAELARRSSGDVHLYKRGFRWTWFDVGLGACGKVNQASDFIVALNAVQWEGGKHCFEFITMEFNGKTATAQIMDLCPPCAYGALDLSVGLFTHFSPLGAGVIQGTWSFGGGGDPNPPPPPPPPPHTPKPVVSISIGINAPPSPSPKPKVTPTVQPDHTTSSASTSVKAASVSSPSPSSSPTPANTGRTLDDLYNGFSGLTGLLVNAASN